MLQAGATEVCITPPIGVELAGYGFRLKRHSTDVHDPLMAQALVLDDGERRVALITSDLITIAPTFTEVVRRDIEKRAHIPPDHVMVSCAHSHTAPTTVAFRELGDPDPGYVRMAARQMAGAVVASVGKLQPAHLSVGRGEHSRLAWNRVGAGDVDPTVEVARVDAADGAPLALLVYYACHPVILGPKRTISADYPGALRRHLQRQYPGVILFANGACGDIDPATNREVWGQGTFADVDNEGAALAASAWAAAQQATLVADARLRVRWEALRLRYDVPTLAAVREQIARYRAEARASGRRSERFSRVTDTGGVARFWLGYYRALERRLLAGAQPDHEEIALQAFLVGGALAMVAIPGELFTAEGRLIRRRSAYPHTLPICYSNGAYGYFPPRAQFEQGGYAAILAAACHDRPPFQPDVAEAVVEAALRTLGPEFPPG